MVDAVGQKRTADRPAAMPGPDNATPPAPGSAPHAGRDWLDIAAFLIVLAAAAGIAALMFAQYYSAPELLWRGFHHDRNSHYSFGLDLALAVRSFDPAWFFGELEKAKVWPPLHGLVLSAVLLIGGIDHRLGIVPSLIGWVMTIAFVWLIARRLFTDRTSGLFAAMIAAIFAAASPTFRLISADVMLEGLGAGLSAAGLWAYLRAEAKPDSRGRWRLLALILTLLFFHKGNYWGLLIAPLAIAYASEHWSRIVAAARPVWAATRGRAVLKATAGSPLLILAAAVAGLVAFLYARGPTTLELFDRSVSLYPPENLLTAAYALVFLWWSLTWWRHRAAIDRTLGVAGRAVLYWHLTPVAISFLLPHRLSKFLWFVGPANNTDPNSGPWQGLQFYATVFADGFHQAHWLAAVAVVLALVGTIAIPRLTPGARAVFLFALLAWIGVIIHPQHQGRFMSTWVFTVWICAGVGAGVLLSLTGRWLSPLRRGAIAAVLTIGLLTVHLLTPVPKAGAAYALQDAVGPSDLELIRPYLAELDGAHEVAVFTTFGMSKLFAWVLRERCRCHMLVPDPFLAGVASREAARDAMADRIAQSTADVVVIIDAPRSRDESPSFGWVHAKMVGIVDAMADQTRYLRGNSYALPIGEATATIWRRR
ncbi:glycosyltransferase family 39 protein [Rhodopseudomonas palustris]|uniref:glycosyltransferase family 39 protein n=1 Tax=Rhodopseudomonas palustris TaxID=1076 RepID=UPI000641C78A|nr:glycosyltransferase family 39 protein [Rhodopseudomonas palustris]